MPSYLERYQQGQCEQVWAELAALGGQIRQQPLYTEALAVARETMSRARTNIELLVPRLTALGYRFAHPDRVFVAADEETRRLTADVERRAGPLPLSLRVWFEEVGEVNFMGSHPKLSSCLPERPGGRQIAVSFLSLFSKHGGAAAENGDPLRRSVDLSQGLLNEVIEGMRTGAPRSPNVEAGVRASREFLAQFQRPAASAEPELYSDPLVVEPYFGDLEDELDDEADNGADDSGPYDVIIAPDPVHKTNQSGGSPYCISFPDPAIDARLEGEEDYGTFIEYLRACFRWGGFPGLRSFPNPPRDELAYLTQGLAPL
jgi:hypothetical protein